MTRIVVCAPGFGGSVKSIDGERRLLGEGGLGIGSYGLGDTGPGRVDGGSIAIGLGSLIHRIFSEAALVGRKVFDQLERGCEDCSNIVLQIIRYCGVDFCPVLVYPLKCNRKDNGTDPVAICVQRLNAQNPGRMHFPIVWTFRRYLVGIRWAEIAIEFGMWHEYPSPNEIRSYADECVTSRLVTSAECTTDKAGGSPIGSNAGGGCKFSGHAESRCRMRPFPVCGVSTTRYSDSVERK